MMSQIPERDQSKPIDYVAECALYASLIKKRIKISQAEYSNQRGISYPMFRKKMHGLRSSGNTPVKKRAVDGPAKKSNKNQNYNAEHAVNNEKKPKVLPKEEVTIVTGNILETLPAFKAASIADFNVFDENKKLLQGCVEILAGAVTQIKSGALLIKKISDVKIITGAIRDIQATLEKLTPDYSKIGMQQEIGAIFDRLMKEEIDVIEAALTIEKAGMPLPDSIKILLSKSEPIEKEPEYEAISEEQIIEKRRQNLLKLKAEQSGQGAKIFEIQKLKEELRTSGSFDVEADEEKEA